jgi:hypothetical protein
MRTTVDIDDNLDQELRGHAAALGIPYKEALNRVIAAGLPVFSSRPPVFTVLAKECGWRAGVDPLHLNRLADELDDEVRLSQW